ncbi:hypothetical protein GUITHDRAFT_70376 [Guillardia theta CCMP2712]|uniref:DUF218 domain-containing protein n=1 Tax=Guillardia theta (strain CCMP2712) TaxID=905079 RepID=L1JET1_GUITC|nr:hypothetical protein GUITHDRAFT_70376 [Guillardia theta CCMP2712]EKX46615.1 hypothetical protein GUITHDRAFT_70376 [Guillardia theta CCMP2712]|eukprot:XP_005833595.1 hypothetical protein GUITHDRAFT_70376 [Guillardia theta CCMP2712]
MEKSLGGFVPSRDWSNLTHLIMVAGHTVFMGTDFSSAGSQGDRWFLYDYQRNQFDWFLQHITAGVKLAQEDPSSLLLFSGGATRMLAGPRTEAQSYWLYADAQDWFLDPSKYTRMQIESLKHRVHTEDFARDSFENLLFSICRFRQLTGRYPEKITVVSLPFKEKRFREIHRKALRFPIHRFEFVGRGGSPPAAVEGELRHSLTPYERDPYGCRGSLAEKRKSRNPFNMAVPYPQGCEELTSLFKFCGTNIYFGTLPWDP